MIERLPRSWRGPALAGALSLLPFWQVLAGDRTTIYGDAQDQFLPTYRRVWGQILDGVVPFWDQSQFAGSSMLGSGQTALLYPFNAVFGILEATNAMRWWLVVHLLIGATAMYAWALRRWRSPAGSVVAAVAWSLSSFHVLHLLHMNFFAQASWLPLVFLGVDLLNERWTTARAAVAAVPLGLMAWLGGPMLLWIAAIGLVIYAGFASSDPRSRFWSDMRIAGGLALGAGLGAVQLLPTYLFSKDSVRPELSMEDAFSYSTQTRHLLNLVFPYLYGGAAEPPGLAQGFTAGPYPIYEVLPYAGAGALVLALVGAWTHWRDKAVRAALLMALVGIVIALADDSPLGEWIYRNLPMASGFRSWGRASILTQLAIALLSAAGVRAVLERPRTHLAALAAGVLGVVTLALAAPRWETVAGAIAPSGVGFAARVLAVLVVVGLLSAALLRMVHPRLGVAALVAVASIELVGFAFAAEWQAQGLEPSEAASRFDPEREPAFGPVLDAPGGVDRWGSNTAFFGEALVTGTEFVQGLDPLVLADYAETVAGLAPQGFPTRPDLWEQESLADLLRVTTLALPPEIVPGARGWRRARERQGGQLIRWERMPRLPAAYLVGEAEVRPLADIRAALADPTPRWARTALVEEELDVPLDDAGRSGEVVELDQPNPGAARVVAERDSLLVVSYAWMEGWQAEVDGDPVPVVRANGLLLGIPVPAGQHDVTFRFVPPGLRLGAAVSLLSLFVLVAVAPGATWWRRRRRPAGRQQVPEDVPGDGWQDDAGAPTDSLISRGPSRRRA